MIESSSGDLLSADTELLVNTVNCAGVMGKGVALAFKRKYPAMFRIYRELCDTGEIRIGEMTVWTSPEDGRVVVNFPTKLHWRNDSKIEYIEKGLKELVELVRTSGASSIAIPKLGCGNGNLDWAVVRPMIVASFSDLPNVRVVLFE